VPKNFVLSESRDRTKEVTLSTETTSGDCRLFYIWRTRTAKKCVRIL